MQDLWQTVRPTSGLLLQSWYLGTGEEADQDSCISNKKKQLTLMGNLAGHEKKCHLFILLEALH